MPNIALLFMSSYLFEQSFVVRFGFNLMMRSLKSELFKTDTIDRFLWNSTDPILLTAEKIAPTLIPRKNVGILNRIYEDYEDTETVYIAPKFGERDFFLIDKFDGSEDIPHLKQCNEKVKRSSDDVLYFQGITKNDTIRFFRKSLCRVANLDYTREFTKHSMSGYRFEMMPNFYNRTYPLEEDCYKGHPTLPNGLIDISFCNYESSVAASFPHFLYGDSSLHNSIDGLKPDKEKHTPYIEVEPITGIPFGGAARSQLNIVVKDMKGFNEKLHRLTNQTIPLLWIEVFQETLPLKVQWLVYLQIAIMPIFQKVLLVTTFSTAILLVWLFIRRRQRYNKKRIHSAVNRALAFEDEKFLKR